MGRRWPEGEIKEIAVGRIRRVQCITGGKCPFNLSHLENQKHALQHLAVCFHILNLFSEAKRLLDLSLSPSLSISGEEEMKGIGEGQRPGGESQGIIINLHDQTLSFICGEFGIPSRKQVRCGGTSNIWGKMPEDNQSARLDVRLTNKSETHFPSFSASQIPPNARGGVPGQWELFDIGHKEEKEVLFRFGSTGQRQRTRGKREERKRGEKEPFLSSSLCKRGA